MEKKLFTSIISLLLILPLYAQQYHDAAVEEMVGAIKEIVYVNRGLETISYDSNGQETRAYEQKENRLYDKDGYLVSYEYESNGMHWVAHVKYDGQHRMKEHQSVTDGGRIILVNSYNKDGYVSHATVTIEAADVKRTYMSTFVYMTYDEHGNWLSRIRKGRRSAEYEARVIRYY